jgi:hypothetical protein
MMKIYDMDTYEIREPDEDTSTLDSARPFAAELTATTVVQLQLIEASPIPLRQDLHPSLRYTDVDSFLAGLSD